MPKRVNKPTCLRIESLESREVFAAEMLTDLNKLAQPGDPDMSDPPVMVGTTMYHTLVNENEEIELWKQQSGEASERVGLTHIGIRSIVAVDDVLYFSSTRWNSSFLDVVSELWRSDGTVEGTFLVRSIQGKGSIYNMQSVDGVLLFSYGIDLEQWGGLIDGPYDPASEGVLWQSDGTEAGTIAVADAPEGTLGARLRAETQANGFAYYVGDTDEGPELWRTDTTPAQTRLVSSARIAREDARFGYDFYYLDGPALYKTDGTVGGTGVVREVPNDPLPDGGNYHRTRALWTGVVSAEGRLYFATAGVASAGSPVLWTSDGTAEGTLALRGFWPRSFEYSYMGWHSNYLGVKLITVGSRVFFTSVGNGTGQELWTSDGTIEGTRMVRDLTPGNDDGLGNFLLGGRGADGFLYFVGSGPGGEDAIWRTDGTAENTTFVADFTSVSPSPSAGATYGKFFSKPDGVYFFVHRDDQSPGLNLWRIGADGVPERVLKLKTGTQGLSQQEVARTSQHYYFHAEGMGYFAANMATGVIERIPTQIFGKSAVVGDVLYFMVRGKLWKSDGTSAGTQVVSAAPDGELISSNGVHVVGDKLFFIIDGLNQAPVLWISDGTADGTHVVSTLPDVYEIYMASAGDQLYLTTVTLDNEWTLWQSDGTASGTFAIPQQSGWRPSPNHVVMNGSYYYTAWTRLPNDEARVALWRLDPGSQTPTQFVDIPRGITSLQVVGERILLTEGDDVWSFDGTSLTQLFDNVKITSSVVVGSKLYYFREIPGVAFRYVLAATDGTVAGTYDIKSFTGDDELELRVFGQAKLAVYQGQPVFLAGYGPMSAVAIWTTDGTEAGTRPFYEFEGGLSGRPNWTGGLIPIGDGLFFLGHDPLHSTELWRYLPDPSETVQQNATNKFDVNGDGDVAPEDALLVIEGLSRRKSQQAFVQRLAFPFFTDVDGDHTLTPEDALMVIEALIRKNRQNKVATETSAATSLAEIAVGIASRIATGESTTPSRTAEPSANLPASGENHAVVQTLIVQNLAAIDAAYISDCIVRPAFAHETSADESLYDLIAANS